ncbi:site-specific integrase [Methylomonas lenta]|uniref:hypothetical protein n=1 Tax=Methylomonas lenta TaxID=980561 RepID=UPI001E2ACD03|nr:hypothetical protein [Methylomonas lenta]
MFRPLANENFRADVRMKGIVKNKTIPSDNRALIAFTWLTGARDSTIASMKLKHVDLVTNCVFQDAREVNTKFSKTFTTYFFPVGDEIQHIVADRVFKASGLKPEHWSNASPIRSIFREAFETTDLPYFNSHSFLKPW